MSELLKPCPFCGETELIWVDDGTPECWNFKEIRVSCTNPECDVKPSVWGVDNWNKLMVLQEDEVVISYRVAKEAFKILVGSTRDGYDLHEAEELFKALKKREED